MRNDRTRRLNGGFSSFRFRIVVALVVASFASLVPVAALSESGDAAPPDIDAASAILVDAHTGTVLYALHPDRQIPPASLTKLMTLEVLLDRIDDGTIRLDQVVTPVEPAWASSMPPDSSLMFLGPHQRLTVRQLITGLVVDSGNDAAYEIAYLVAGSVGGFVDIMNQTAQQEGYTHMHFTDPSGILATNMITAAEYAEFCRRFIALHPDVLENYLAVRSFTYPQETNETSRASAQPITQKNRNELLWTYPGADGLKTGFIDESGYNIAGTAVRDGMRLIAVVLGVKADSEAAGSRLRAEFAGRLFDYGFGSFREVTPELPALLSVHVWGGEARATVPVPLAPPVVVVPVHRVGDVRVNIEQVRNVRAPLRSQQNLGTLSVMLDGHTIARQPLVAPHEVLSGSIVRRILDGFVIFVRNIFGAGPDWSPELLQGPPGP